MLFSIAAFDGISKPILQTFYYVNKVFFVGTVSVQVYEQSISAVCQIDWPKDHLLIQVLDDSDNESIQLLIKTEVAKWSQKGINIIYRHRVVRTGYKAGNLKSAMGCDYVMDCEFVAIFDADFQPNPDFLKQTVPHFKVGKLIQSHFHFRVYYLEYSFFVKYPCSSDMIWTLVWVLDTLIQ